jgi:zinc transport system ATP-binding protein
MSLLKVDNLSYSYDKTTQVLQNINLEVNQKDFLAIIGPNGGGKSTLLSLITKLLPIQTGKIMIDKNINLGYVPQNTNINTDFPITVLDVVLMGHDTKDKFKESFISKIFGYSKHEKKCALDSLTKVGMQDFASKKIGLLSGGQRQRVMIARALSAHPDILILDEPTSSIDIDGQKQIYELLKELNKYITIIVVSHDISVVFGYANKVAHINRKLTYHNNIQASNKINQDEHFCEIELIQMLSDTKNNQSQKSCSC